MKRVAIAELVKAVFTIKYDKCVPLARQPTHATWPKTRAAFRLAKITGNKARDRKVNRLLRAKGWKVIRVWEHELAKKNVPKLLKRLKPLA